MKEKTIELDLNLKEYYTLNEEARKQNLLLDGFVNKILEAYIETIEESIKKSS